MTASIIQNLIDKKDLCVVLKPMETVFPDTIALIMEPKTI